MSILDKNILAEIDTMRENATKNITFSIKDNKLCVKAGKKTMLLKLELSLKEADSLNTNETDIIKMLSGVCDNADALADLPASALAYIFGAYSEAIERFHGVTVGE